MINAWKYKKLGDICSLQNGRAFKKSDWSENGLPIIRIANLNSENAQFNHYNGVYDKKILIEKDDLLFSWSGTIGSSFGPHLWKKENALLNQHIFKVNLSENLSKKFVYYLLLNITSELEKQTRGAVGLVHVNKSTLVDFEVEIPSLTEQKQIVETLDKAFEKIDKAIANIERNIENAEELNKSFVNNILTPTKEWLTSNFELLFKLKSGEALSSKKMHPGSIPVYGGNGITGFHNSSNLSPPQVIVGRVGANCGNVRLVEKNIWLTDNAFSLLGELQKFNLNYLTHALNFLNLRSFARQSAQPVISNSSLKKIKFAFPGDIEEQKLIAKKIDCIKSESQKLVSGYQKKLIELKYLKKSILEKAFKGELTSAV